MTRLLRTGHICLTSRLRAGSAQFWTQWFSSERAIAEMIQTFRLSPPDKMVTSVDRAYAKAWNGFS